MTKQEICRDFFNNKCEIFSSREPRDICLTVYRFSLRFSQMKIIIAPLWKLKCQNTDCFKCQKEIESPINEIAKKKLF